jgi:signal transduction histidine kinase
VAFALAGSLPIHLEFGRGSLAVVLDETVWVVGLFALTPAGVVVAAVAGDALAKIVARQAPLKTVYNLASTFLAATLGAALFQAIGWRDAGAPSSWVAVIMAMAVLSGTSLLCVSIVLAIVERRTVRATLMDSAGPQAGATAANASIGLATVALLHTSAAGPLVLAPALLTVVLASRRYALQAAEHLRFERLYEAASRTSALAGFDAELVTLAAEARGLVTGSVAFCCAARPSGEWSGARVDDTGYSSAPPASVRALVDLADAGRTRTVVLDQLDPELRRLLPDGVDLVVAASSQPARADVILAVFREIASDGQDDGRREVLGAFAGHAALVVANAVLFDEVDAALRREVDLGRQKSEFVAAVSHELRTPLTTVLGAVGTIQRLGQRIDAPTQEHLLSRAIDQGGRLRKLIDELLLVAAAQHSGLRADMATVDIAHVVTDTTGGLDSVAGRLRLEILPGTGVVRTDGEKVRRIITNLVDNAGKYAPAGPVTVRVGRTGEGVAVSVSDHGPGIPAADRQRVFEPFVQLDQTSTRRQGGTGLGLHLCRQLADLVGGRLELDEPPGGGSRFTLHLPDRAGAVEPDSSPIKPCVAGSPTPRTPEGVLL